MDEARVLVAYHERILETSASPQRRERAQRMLVNLRPELERLENVAQLAAVAPAAIHASLRDRFESVWDGRSSLRDLNREPEELNELERLERGER